ncbi:MAG: TetR/AcrR family transcriptional regulator [Candidatus Dormibacteraeota bacterium]|nr:TetR/AcrR family transcriptional regulator [Candidatus Dormibacteraeota bacterium]
MATVKQAARRYRSGHRSRQAASTRRAILDAARRLFPERGYGGTTIEAIADAAGVAGITVYTAFGSKRALLQQLFHVTLTGDEDPTPIIEREEPRQVMALTNQREQIHRFAAGIAEIMERIAPLFDVLADAARSEPEMAELYESTMRGRLEGMRTVAAAIARNGPLRDAVPIAQAGDIIFALTSAEMVLLLTRRLGWSRDQYVAWLDQTLLALLLPPDGDVAGGSLGE